MTARFVKKAGIQNMQKNISIFGCMIASTGMGFTGTLALMQTTLGTLNSAFTSQLHMSYGYSMRSTKANTSYFFCLAPIEKYSQAKSATCIHYRLLILSS